ncbi:MAG: glycosyltransferase family 4 protein [Candidatus Marinimicrobia bacterium]|nr:glycosyltransferase family 4 protein [Candidatus Neomarinimicrobiota bacterium]
MRIWMFNHYAVTPDLPGGTRHFDFAKELVKRGHEVTVFASSFHYSLLKETETYSVRKFKFKTYDGVNFVWIKSFPYKRNDWRRVFNMLSYSYLSWKVAKGLHKKKPDVVLGSTVHPFAALAASMVAKRYKVPFVFEIRDLWPQTLIDMGVWRKNSLTSLLFRKVEEKTVKACQAIVVLSPMTKNYIKENYKGKKAYYIPNGVDLRRFDIDMRVYGNPTIDFLSQRKREGKFLVAFTGALVKSNNLEQLVEIANRLREIPDIQLVLIGRGQERKSLVSQIKKGDLKNIKILDPVRKAEVPHLLKIVDALLLVQGKVFWGSMNKLFDYLSAGKPVVASVYADHNNPIERINAGITVPPGDLEALSWAIFKLYNMSKREREEMGMRGKEYVRRYHSIPVLVDKFEGMLCDLVRQGRL